jgi:hypothetical protein
VDLNEDGRTDFLWYNYLSTAVSSWNLNGAGGMIGSTALSGGSNGTWRPVAAGDFNEDGHTDLLWFDYATTAVGIWYLNGAGEFVQSAGLSNGGNGTWRPVAVGDIDGDGHQDVVWFDVASTAVGVWYLDGRGGFRGSAGISPGGNGTWRPVALGDFNRDGSMDLLWYDTASTGMGIWYLNGGKFIRSVNVSSGNLGTWRPVAVGDYNNDNIPDIALYDVAGSRVDLWLLNPSAGYSSSIHLAAGNLGAWVPVGLY